MSAFNQAAFNLAAYNTIKFQEIQTIDDQETISAAAALSAILYIHIDSNEKITGIAYTRREILSGFNGAAFNLLPYNTDGDNNAYLETDGQEIATGIVHIEQAKYIRPFDDINQINSYIEFIAACIRIAGNETVDGQITIDPGRGILPIVRARMGIYYSDPHKNWEIWQLILEAKEDLITSGWPEIEMISGRETEMAITAICVHCLRTVGEITDDHADRILRGLQTKASIRKARANADD